MTSLEPWQEKILREIVRAAAKDVVKDVVKITHASGLGENGYAFGGTVGKGKPYFVGDQPHYVIFDEFHFPKENRFKRAWKRLLRRLRRSAPVTVINRK